MQRLFLGLSACAFAVIFVLAWSRPWLLLSLVLLVPVFALGLADMLQTRRAVLRNFPVIGHFRYWLEAIRPEINQYFIESNTDGKPFSREQRSVVYQRAKHQLETLPFGTQRDVYQAGYEWMNHSIAACSPPDRAPRVRIGGRRCKQPHDASLLNISAMSFGALSANAIRALNGGAKLGGFLHNTGEGGVSPYHLEPGGDLVWQIGTGYFGCRTQDGSFCEQAFAKTARLESVKMIEIKLSQGAKPGHGGILPAAKVSAEIGEIRGVPLGKDVLSPPAHTAFDSPRGLCEWIERLRELSGGKPIGFKLCVGHRSEFLGLCKAMRETGLLPDFITVDGGEGGTGAAPIEFSNSIGAPLTEGLVFVHNALVGFDLRSEIKLIASGKIVTGFHIAQRLAAGADLCAAARGFMFSLGCIQALRCNSNQCPVGVATQNPHLMRGLVVADKTRRVANFHAATVRAFTEALAAAGMTSPSELRPWHMNRRISRSLVKKYDEIFTYLEPGVLLAGPAPAGWERSLQLSSQDRFGQGPTEVEAPGGEAAGLNGRKSAPTAVGSAPMGPGEG